MYYTLMKKTFWLLIFSNGLAFALGTQNSLNTSGTATLPSSTPIYQNSTDDSHADSHDSHLHRDVGSHDPESHGGGSSHDQDGHGGKDDRILIEHEIGQGNDHHETCSNGTTLIRHKGKTHGDECHDLKLTNSQTACPQNCKESINLEHFHCDMKWPRLNDYTTNGTEKRYPCRAAKGHHGVQLYSWRYEEYGDMIEILVVMMAAGVLKIMFHHLPKWIENLKSHDQICCCTWLNGLRFILRGILKLLAGMPESCVLILAGVLVACFFQYLFHTETIEFTPDLFFHILLPPIIMDAAFAIYNRDFMHQFPVIILFAVVGTLLNVFTIGGALLLVQSLGGIVLPSQSPDDTNGTQLDPLNCFTFSALISAVDPVAVLAIFQEIGVNSGLYFLVFGESLLNDGVTIVLYNSMVALGGGEVGAEEIIISIISFFFVVFGGFLIGVIFGLISTIIVKYTRHCRELEPFTILSSTYLAFVIAECIHWSGIIAILGCGIVQKRYAFRNISKKSFWTIKYGLRTMATFSDCVIFICLGIVCVFNMDIWNDWNTSFALWTCIFCTLFRFGATFLLSGLINVIGSHHFDHISFKEQFIMGYGGLRGAVGFSLAMIMTDTNKFKDLFLTTAIFMVYFTTFLQGGTIKWIVGWLSIKKAETQVKNISDDVHWQTIDNSMGGIEAIIGGIHRNVVLEVISHYDKKYVEKWVLHDGAVNLLASKSESMSIKDHYTRLYGPRITASKADSWTPEHSGIASRARVQTFAPEDGDRKGSSASGVEMRAHEDTDALKLAFESHPYAVYANKIQQPDYENADPNVALENCVKHQQKRTSLLWDKAFSENKRTSLAEKRKSSPFPRSQLTAIDESEDDVDQIIEVYKEVKAQSQPQRPTSNANTSKVFSSEAAIEA